MGEEAGEALQEDEQEADEQEADDDQAGEEETPLVGEEAGALEGTEKKDGWGSASLDMWVLPAEAPLLAPG